MRKIKPQRTRKRMQSIVGRINLKYTYILRNVEVDTISMKKKQKWRLISPRIIKNYLSNIKIRWQNKKFIEKTGRYSW